MTYKLKAGEGGSGRPHDIQTENGREAKVDIANRTKNRPPGRHDEFAAGGATSREGSCVWRELGAEAESVWWVRVRR